MNPVNIAPNNNNNLVQNVDIFSCLKNFNIKDFDLQSNNLLLQIIKSDIKNKKDIINQLIHFYHILNDYVL